jgi:hypothetical protein
VDEMSFVKLDRYYANLDYIALVEESGDSLIVRFHHMAKDLPTTVSVRKDSNEGQDLVKALKSRMP